VKILLDVTVHRDKFKNIHDPSVHILQLSLMINNCALVIIKWRFATSQKYRDANMKGRAFALTVMKLQY
jgi:hypothetical protein